MKVNVRLEWDLDIKDEELPKTPYSVITKIRELGTSLENAYNTDDLGEAVWSNRIDLLIDDAETGTVYFKTGPSSIDPILDYRILE